jgi:hypothetical protein
VFAPVLLVLLAEYGQAHFDLVAYGLLGKTCVEAKPVALDSLSSDVLGFGAIPDLAGGMLSDIADWKVKVADFNVAIGPIAGNWVRHRDDPWELTDGAAQEGERLRWANAEGARGEEGESKS